VDDLVTVDPTAGKVVVVVAVVVVDLVFCLVVVADMLGC